MSETLDTFSLARGFRAAAASCGLKTSSAMGASALDVALVVADRLCSAAGVFTTNRVKAAPVLYDQELLGVNAGGIRAVITNAGNANACTGPQGVANCRRTAELTAYALRCQPNEVLVLSTGVIGRQLPMDKLAQGIATVTSPAAERGADAAARAIMTTDTRPKTASRMLETAEGTVTVSGFCKGAGMIHPNMATMLAILTTDAQLAPATLDLALRRAVNVSFNRISVDGDTSTNDTVLILASGASGVMLEGGPLFAQFVEGLTLVCQSLAKQVARDGEGATRLVEIHVTGARDEQEAHTVANSIARSPLVKTAVHGGDPNWGRVLCAAGYSGAAINQERLSLTFGPGDNDTPAVQVVANGLPTEADLSQAAATLRSDPVRIALDLGLGEAEATVWTCDLSAEYVVVNAHYTT